MLNKRQTEVINLLKIYNKGMIKSYKDLKKPFLYYKNVFDLILREGVFYSKGRWNADELDIINSLYSQLKRRIGTGICYKNSQLAIIYDKSNMIKYHEGFYIDLFPINHGWNTLNGKLIDFTFEYANKTKFPKDTHIGIEISKAWVLDRFKNKLNITPYIETIEEGHNALQNKYSINSNDL